MGEIGDIADNGSDQHRADISRENQSQAVQESADQCPQSHGQEQMGHGIHEMMIVDGLAGDVFLLDDFCRFFFAAGNRGQFVYFFLADRRVETFRIGMTVQVVFVDQLFTDRAADEAAGDEAEGSCGDGDGSAAIETHFFQEGTKGSRCSMTADHGNGAGCQPHIGTEAEQGGQADAQDILDDDEYCRDDSHFKDHDAAAADQAQTGRIADAGEEQHHADVLHDRILLIRPDALSIQQAVQGSEQDAADDRSRDAVRPEGGNLHTQEDAGIIHQDGRSQRLIDIELYRQRNTPPLHNVKLICWYRKQI